MALTKEKVGYYLPAEPHKKARCEVCVSSVKKGNFLACEALGGVKVNPKARCSAFSTPEFRELVDQLWGN